MEDPPTACTTNSFCVKFMNTDAACCLDMKQIGDYDQEKIKDWPAFEANLKEQGSGTKNDDTWKICGIPEALHDDQLFGGIYETVFEYTPKDQTAVKLEYKCMENDLEDKKAAFERISCYTDGYCYEDLGMGVNACCMY